MSRQFQAYPQVRVVTEIGKLDFNFLREGVVTVRSMSGGPDYDGPLTINRGSYASLWADVYKRSGAWTIQPRDMRGPWEKPLTKGAWQHAERVILATIERLLAAEPALARAGQASELSNKIRGLESTIASLSADLDQK